MKITLKALKEKGACKRGIEWFKKHFKTQTDHTEIIKQLVKEKTTTNWIGWLLKEFELSGRYQRWYDNGKKWCDGTYKNGVLDGRCQEWYSNGQKYTDCTYKNGELKRGDV